MWETEGGGERSPEPLKVRIRVDPSEVRPLKVEVGPVPGDKWVRLGDFNSVYQAEDHARSLMGKCFLIDGQVQIPVKSWDELEGLKKAYTHQQYGELGGTAQTQAAYGYAQTYLGQRQTPPEPNETDAADGPANAPDVPF